MARKVLSIFGTRPEAIKMAPVVKVLEATPEIESVVAVTGQHREMLDQVLELFSIEPAHDLNIMKPGQTLFGITRATLKGLERVLSQEKPDMVLVQGDTTTAFVSGLGAFYEKVPVGHVEAGLRTQNIYDPFPEEANRRLLTTITALHFPPTGEARRNLLEVKVPDEQILVTGNTVCDALQMIARNLPAGLPEDLLTREGEPLKDRIPSGHRFLLVEAHRRENLGQPMADACKALAKIVENFPEIHIVFSVHKNPKVREVVFPALGNLERVHLLEPVDYPVLIRLIRECMFILTDSGGIQEEAPSLGKPVLVMRKTTERPEGVHAGVAKLVGMDTDTVYEEAQRLLTQQSYYESMSRVENPYGDGRAAERIRDGILHYFGGGVEPRPFVVGASQRS